MESSARSGEHDFTREQSGLPDATAAFALDVDKYNQRFFKITASAHTMPEQFQTLLTLVTFETPPLRNSQRELYRLEQWRPLEARQERLDTARARGIRET